MRSLPAEIFTEIFLHLDQRDKMECMLVCHHWKQVIEQAAFYQTVYIYSVDALNKLTCKMQEQPGIKTKIEQLIIFLEEESDLCNLEKLFPSLSNLKALIYYHLEKGIKIKNKRMINKETTYQWHKHIKYMSEQSGLGLALRLLSSGVCYNLTTLEINHPDREIIPFLKNAPALKELTMINLVLGFNNLEFIHENIPYLESLKLSFLKFSDFEFNGDVEPAETVTECVFDLLESREAELRIPLLVYIRKKYPNVTKLTFNMATDPERDNTIESLIQFGWNPLFAAMGHQLKKLCVDNGGYITDLFETLDASSCQLEDLRISGLSRSEFAKIAQSKQSFYIQNLTLMQMEFGSFAWLKKLKKLKSLDLSWNFLRLPVILNDILDNAPFTLQSLSFSYMNIAIDPNYTHSSAIESLSFQMANFPDNLDAFISRHFPQLHDLKISCCNQPGDTFDLTPIDLINFHFTQEYWGPDDITVSIVSAGKNEQRQYSLKDRLYIKHMAHFKPLHHSIFPTSNPWSMKKTNNEPNFTFKCNSVKHLSFN